MLIKLLIPRLLVTASVLLVVTVGVRAPRTIKGPRDFVKPDYSSPVKHKRTHDEDGCRPTGTYYREHIHPPNHPRDSNTYTDTDYIYWPPNLPQRPRNPCTHDYSPPVSHTDESWLKRMLNKIIGSLRTLSNETKGDIPRKEESQNSSELGNYAKFLEDINVAHQEMYLNETRHDDIDKASLPIQQPKSQSKKLLFNRMLYKIIDSLWILANETIVVRELLKGDIPREDESKNSSEPIQNCTHHIEQIQKRMTSFKDRQKSVLYSINDFEQAYDILRESWNTKLENMISRPNSFLITIEELRPLRENIRTEDKFYDSSKPATTLRQALAQLYIQDHVKLEITNCTHQIDHFQKQMRLFEAQQIKVYDSITKLKYEYKILIESWETELKNVIEKVHKKLYKDIQLLRSTDREQEIIMEDPQKLDYLQVSSDLFMPLEKLPKRLIFLTDPFKWKHNIWQFQSNELRKSDNLTGDLKQNKWLIFKQIDPQLKRWRLVATTVPETTFGEAQGRVEPTNSDSPIMQHSTWTFLGKIRWNDTNCDLQQCGWLVFNQTDPLLNLWRLVVSSPIRTEKQQNQSEPHTTLEKSHCSVVPTVPSKGNYAKFLEDIKITHQEMYLNNTRHDDNDKASLVIQQPKSLTEELLFDWMSHKIIDSLRTLANETIAVQELLKGDIPRKEESQNSSELGNYAKFLEDINVAHQEMYLNKTRHDDNDKASLPIQQPKSQSKKLLFNRLLYKIIDSLRKLANETIVVRELLNGDIPREDESKNSSEPIQNCTHHVEQIQKRMTSFKDLQKSVLDSIVDFEQAYDILRESWNTKLENMISRPNSFLRMIEVVRPLREKIRTEDKFYDSSKPATTLRQALAQLYIQDHVKLEITNCTHQIDHFQKQMRLFEAQQIKVYDSITKLKYEYKFLIESWETELKNVIEKVHKKLYKDIQLLRSTDHKQEIIMDYTQKLDELQVSSELVMPLEKLRKRLIFLTDPFKWEHNIWQFQSNELRKSDNLTGDLKQNKWLIFKQIDPQLKRWRLVATTVPETTFGEAQGRVEPTNSGSPIMHSTWTFLGKIRWNDTNCDLQQCGWLVFNQTDPLLNLWRLVVSSPIRTEKQQNQSEPHTTLEKSHCSVVPTVPSKGNYAKFLEDIKITHQEMYLNNTRHDDNDKASLVIQQPKSHTEESWLNQMLIKIIGSLRTSANETIAVQESIKGDIPQEEESQNSSKLNNTRHDDNGKASLPIQQPEGNYAKFLEDINVAYQEMYLNKTRHDDIDKTSLPIQQPKSQSKKLLFNRMLYKIIDSLRKLANETIVVRELLKGDIPREDESKNSSEPIQNCTHHIEQIQKRMTSFKDLQKSVLDSIVDFEQAYDILRESWNTKLENMISSPNSFLRMIGVRPLREKIRTEDKLYDSSKPATTLRQALAQLYIQDHVKLEISNCTHQIDHFQKQMRLFEAQQIKVYDSITKLKYEYKLLIESWETELKNVIDRNVPIEKVYKKVYKDIQLLRSTDHEQEIIMEDTEKLDELQVSSELAMPLEKLPKRLIFLTDPFKWKHNIWQFQSNELRKSDNLTGDLKQNKWLIFKQIDPQLKRWRLVATTVPETTFGEAQGRVEPTNLGSPIMVIKRRYLNSYVFSS
eukprot:XP_016663208.1 PREDICTED: uncharacterized protein LOC100573471 isoform X2 [Acyrthosiphon pisum]